MIEKVLECFKEKFGGEGDIRSYFAPGRVNLIGEHTDYNGGHVFPCALSMGNYGVARKRDDRTVRLYNMTYPDNGVQERSLDELTPNDNGLWYDYQHGVLWAMLKAGIEIPCGYDMVMAADLPAGSGLSASASIEELAAIIVKDLNDLPIDMVDCARYGQVSENEYNGSNSGIMDQFASALGKKDHAIFLDTSDLSYEYVPLNMKAEKIVIANSKVKHNLTENSYNSYNTRRRESEEALAALKRVVDIDALGELDNEEFDKLSEYIENEVNRKRARHAVYENQRTIQAVRELRAGHLEAFGRLMNDSHISLRDDYAVSCEELDILAEEAWKLPGVIGSRMTGGGFGGCTVSIVKNENVDDFIEVLGKKYGERTGIKAEFYIADASDGARRLD
ncbi:MAG: galactokinase [Lachnospiraceae bacterium]|nr:galactokinase [Lachnospiraceae bacterium]MBR1914627.1 galactokinase [Lachnospiraceae bacterium]